MIDISLFFKELRRKNNLSQRGLAGIAGLSYRQIQRIENFQSDITVNKLISFLNKFGFELRISAKEPDWNVLYNFGLPLNTGNAGKQKYKYSIIVSNIITAVQFLLENKHDVNYGRHYDAFKAMLLALKTHYPTRFIEVEKMCGINISESFDLGNVQGRHIKLRNICLARMSGYL